MNNIIHSVCKNVNNSMKSLIQPINLIADLWLIMSGGIIIHIRKKTLHNASQSDIT